MSKSTLIAAIAMVAAHDGYRRAGIDLVKGENKLEVTEAQFAQLDADPRITVQHVTESKSSTSQSTGGAKKEPTKVTFDAEAPDELDLSKFEPEGLAHYVAAVHAQHKAGKLELNADGKPNVGDLAVEVDGKTVKPSATDRDAVWEGYKALIGA